MPIFTWEQEIIDFFQRFSREGFFFNCVHFFSYPGFWGWLFWLFALLFLYRHNLRTLMWPLLLGALASGLGDLTSRRLLKEFVQRPRPRFLNEICNDPACWGFVSSHTSNITAFVTVFCWHNRRNLNWGIPIVGLVSFSRVFLLDHYPLDVLGGIGLGLIIGSIVWLISKYIGSKTRRENNCL